MDKYKELKKRADLYKEPSKFLGSNMFESDMLSEMQLQHWQEFDRQIKLNKEQKAGDFIDAAVKVSANQLAKKLEELATISSLVETKQKIYEMLDDIYKEIEANE